MAVFVLAVAAPSGYAQAIFKTGSTTPNAADIGQTELTGDIILTVLSGTTVQAPFIITYSAPITNNAASEILITGTGGLDGIAPVPELDRAGNAIVVRVPAGGTVGDGILISGVRVAVAGLGLTQVSGAITRPSAMGNAVEVGQDMPVVISAVAQPFSVDVSEPPLSFENFHTTHPSTSFLITEGFRHAFTDITSGGGQTLPSRIRITPYPSIPSGAMVTFEPVAVCTETGAIFRTLSGAAETVPRADGSTDVVFEFIPAAGSPLIAESFQFQVTLALQFPSADAGIIQFQAALVPIGLAVPDQQFPSTDIPRYFERLLPGESDLFTGTTELVFPFRIESDNTYTGVAITNPKEFATSAALTAFDAAGNVISGDSIRNPVTIPLPPKGQYAGLVSEIFGPSFNTLSPGTIRVAGSTSDLQGFYLTGDLSGPGLDGSTGTFASAARWYLPLIFRQGHAPFNLLEIYNPGAAEAIVSLQLLDAGGVQVASAARTIAAGGTLAQDITDIFGVDLGSFEGGYIKGKSDASLLARSTFGNALDSNVLRAQLSSSQISYYIPHFASGGPYSTELTLANVHDSKKSEITLTLLDDSGAAIPIPGNPAVITVPAKNQRTLTLSDLFPALGPELTTGSLTIRQKPHNLGPFVWSPPLIGTVRYAAADGSASASIPIALDRSQDIIYSHVAQDLGYFTGIALLNPNAESASYNIDVYDSDGVMVGSFASLLEPRERSTRLLYEFVPASAGQTGGHIRITSDARLISISLFGTDDIRALSAIPPQIPGY